MYTPTICGRPNGYPARECTREYGHQGDHWHSETHVQMAAHDAEVARAAGERALREAATALYADETAERGTTKAMHHAIYAAWLLDRADRLAATEEER